MLECTNALIVKFAMFSEFTQNRMPVLAFLIFAIAFMANLLIMLVSASIFETAVTSIVMITLEVVSVQVIGTFPIQVYRSVSKDYRLHFTFYDRNRDQR